MFVSACLRDLCASALHFPRRQPTALGPQQWPNRSWRPEVFLEVYVVDLSAPQHPRQHLKVQTMFERYTTNARRVIFFARYEASHYGSAYIETEYMLLGLLREDPFLMMKCLKPSAQGTEIRTEIEKHITRHERVSISVEVPLTDESKKILELAAEESKKLGHRHIGTGHLLLGMLRMESSLAGKILRARGVNMEALEEQSAKSVDSGRVGVGSGRIRVSAGSEMGREPTVTLNSFLAGLKSYDWDRLAPFFAPYVQFIDFSGKRWIGRQEIEKNFEVLLAPYAKKNVTFLLESSVTAPAELMVASILWENMAAGGQSTRSMHRMTIVLATDEEDWVIFLLQVTPVLAR